MPPVFMSHSFGSGRCSSRSNSERRSDSITLRVEQALAVVRETPTHVDRMMTDEERAPGQVETSQARRGVERGVQQDAVDDEPHEQRLDHLQPGADQRQHEQRSDAVAVRPQPTQILAEILTAFAAQQRWLRFFRLADVGLHALGDRPLATGFIGTVVEPPVVVVTNEVLVTLSRRTRVTVTRIVRLAHRVKGEGRQQYRIALLYDAFFCMCGGAHCCFSDPGRPAGAATDRHRPGDVDRRTLLLRYGRAAPAESHHRRQRAGASIQSGVPAER